MDRQTLRDWAHRFNEDGPDGLTNRPCAGRPLRLTDDQMQALAEIVETCPSFLSYPGHERILRRRRRRVFHREGGKGFFGNGVWIRLPAVGKALGAAGSAGESMATPVASSSPHENPRTEPSGVQAASRSYR